jgi:nucleoside phosphorylase
VETLARVALAVTLLAAACSDSSSERRAVDLGSARLLVLSAFPAELDSLLRHATVADTVVIDGRSFMIGELAGNEVILALTGIGLVNAEKTTRSALDAFAVTGIVFSGVSGTRFRIGDVMVPARWTEDGGETWIGASEEMLDVAESAASEVALARCAPAGDPVCVGVDAGLVELACLDHTPEIIFGGDGRSSDPFGGREFPCVPLGGDVFGCEACLAPDPPLPDAAGFLENTVPFIDPDLFQDFADWSASATSGFDVDDMETAAVARVAAETGVPFLGFRAASDGKGDPLGLPGFPVQFFAYRQLAADNAAAVTIAFLEAWRTRPPSLAKTRMGPRPLPSRARS